MAMIKCSECGKEISDKADKCPNCGAPVLQNSTNAQADMGKTAQKQVSKNSTLGVVALILSVIGCTSVIGIILAVIDLLQKDGKKKTCSTIALVICGVWIVIGIAFNSGKDNNVNDTPQGISTTTLSDNETNSPAHVEKESKELIEEESKEDFIASCEEFDYKTLARTPDDYKGKHIKLTVKISQIIQGGFLDNGEYYRVYTNDEYDFWSGDEYLISDNRKEKDVKILQDDIVTVYGEFNGTRQMERALTGTKEDVLTINAVYIELEGESSTESENATNEDIEIISEYTLEDGIGWYTRHFMVIRNNSSETVDVSISSLAYSEDGTVIGSDDASLEALGAGCTSVMYEAFEVEGKIDHYETTLNATKSKYYESVIQDLSFVQNDIENGAVFQVTNNGEDAAEFVEGYALFFENGELVGYENAYFTDDDSEIKAGKTISKQMTLRENFDSIEFYLTGRK